MLKKRNLALKRAYRVLDYLENEYIACVDNCGEDDEICTIPCANICYEMQKIVDYIGG